MFANFKKAFIDNTIPATMQSKLLLKVINKSLPDGFHYKNMGNGIFAMESDSGNFSFKISRENIEVKGLSKQEFDERIHNSQELIEYSYNSQKEIYFYPTDKNQFIINEKSLEASKICFSIDRKLSSDNCFVVTPPPFPEPFPLIFSYDNEKLSIFVHQVPTESAKIKRFESIAKSPIIISYEVEDVSSPIKFKFTIQKTESVKDTISSMIIFNAIIDGTAMLFEKPLIGSTNNKMSRISQSNIDFFKRLLELENELHVNFNATKSITEKDFQIVNELYESIINGKFIISREKDIKLTGQANCVEESKNYDNISTHTNYQFEFTADISVTIFDVDIKLCGVISIWGGKVVKVNKPQKNEFGGFIIELESTEDSQLYNAIRFFVSEEMASEFRKLPEHLQYIKDNCIRKEELSNG